MNLCFCFVQVKDLDCEALFGNIESVLETSRKLLKGLQNAVQTKEGKDQELGKYDSEMNALYMAKAYLWVKCSHFANTVGSLQHISHFTVV